MKFLRHGPEILVGTPGRVIDLLDRRIINFDNIRFVVLDEVDRMLDIGFRDDIRNILSRVKGVAATSSGEERDQRDATARARGGSDGRGNAPRPHGPTPEDAAGDEATCGRRRRRGRVDNGDATPTTTRQRQDASAAATAATRRSSSPRRSATRSSGWRGAYMREPVEKLIAPGADEKPTVEKVEQYYFSVAAVGQVPAAADAAGAREPGAGDRLLPHQARRREARQASCTPTASSAARSTATWPRTSATG